MVASFEPTGEGFVAEGETTGLEEFLAELLGLEGVMMVALLDRSGRVMAAEGFPDGALEDAAALAAGIHASGARLGEAAGDRGFPRTLIQTVDRSVLIAPLPVRAGIPLVLLVVTQRMAIEDLGNQLEEISGISPRDNAAFSPLDDPEAFEASLLESLDGLFPREAPSQ